MDVGTGGGISQQRQAEGRPPPSIFVLQPAQETSSRAGSGSAATAARGKEARPVAEPGHQPARRGEGLGGQYVAWLRE